MRDVLLISVSGGILILAVVAWFVRDDLAADLGPALEAWTTARPEAARPPTPSAERADPAADPAADPPPPPASVGTAPTLRPQPPRPAPGPPAPAYDPAAVTRLPATLARTDSLVDGHRRTRVEARAFGASRWTEADLRRRAEAVCAATVAQRAARGGPPVFRVDARVGPETSSPPIPVTVRRDGCVRVPAPPAPVPLVLSPDLAHLPVISMAVWRYGPGRAVRVGLGGGGPVSAPEAGAVCRALRTERDHAPDLVRWSFRSGVLIVSRGGRDHVLTAGGPVEDACRPIGTISDYGPFPEE
ncbi:hypothetical protein JQC91_13385 [Jannaschia sp. Os4]|uniref:hypothetical protein n=1 Tax=Jannaschia sp. Os4 TaxID=2807617 RepID=UPI00193993A0|nr:hypothetical protein [Jannaschia sp. Os4]MBM2577296.1 hypothetical protein [Jannaschia sp. Os4]